MAPTISTRWKPKVARAVRGRSAIQTALSEMPKEAASLSRCAASVMIASEPAR